MRLIEVRQPQPGDLISDHFVIAGFGSGFEATVLWRVLGDDGTTLGQGLVQGVGSMDTIRDFGHEVSLTGATIRGQAVRLQVFGDDPSGENPPGPDLNDVPVTLFTGLQGWRLHDVQRGDTLNVIARKHGENTRAQDIFAANRRLLDHPDRILPGQILRIPLF